jgi:hypothetical protein
VIVKSLNTQRRKKNSTFQTRRERERGLFIITFNMDQRQIHRMSCRCDCQEFEHTKKKEELNISSKKKERREKVQ